MIRPKPWLPYIVWKGVKSSDMGIVINRLPNITRAGQRMTTHVIPGRHGALHETDDTFENILLPAEFTIRDAGRTDQVFQWLQGSGEVIFSNQPDKKYNACVYNKIDMQKVFRRIGRGQVIFDCFPLKYEITPQPITITKPGMVYNIGTWESEPLITVYGSGAVTVTINGVTFGLTIEGGYITVDSEMQNAYRANILMDNKMTGEFPVFLVGENAVSWAGNVSRLEITGRWRWL